MLVLRGEKEFRAIVGSVMSVGSALAPGGTLWNYDPLPELQAALLDFTRF